ncbi:hypothetical protein HUW62_08675 [Myxococcus sp. AM011]|uniref:hypothetical protein n=1 Tax=Myxococcus sp. AM011 TaxID=2745200 RepID=UPI0015950CD0|nr:hypothetical protein [Myxococcus sp. AM011]NVJ21289.1 hypothetical protein [Myxococcus sp. AM011]
MRRLLAFAVLALPCLVLAAPVSRLNLNSSSDNSRTFAGITPDRPVLQLFMNHVDRATDVSLLFSGAVYASKQDDWLRVRILDGCLNEVFTQQYPLGLTLGPNQRNWFNFPLGVNLTHGSYYYLELSTRYGGWDGSAQLVVNNARYEHGRLFAPGSVQALGFPGKKDDVMFMLNGTVEEAKSWYPTATTNVLCPGRCQVLGTEKQTHGARNQFNVIVQETGTAGATGSFWSDYNSDPALLSLKENLRRVLEEASGPPISGGRQTAPLSQTVPFNSYYGQMNFYVAVENPAIDPRAAKGFLYCANIDAQVTVKTGSYGEYGATAYSGDLPRPSGGAPWQHDFSRGILQHELLGHGIGQLTEEYILAGDTGAMVQTTFSPNMDSIGCSSWCGSSLTVNQLITQMAADPNAACWTYDATTCRAREAPGSSPRCLTLSGLSNPGLAWFGGRACAPVTVTNYNIGQSCTGNTGCYIGKTNGGVIVVNAAQPGGDIMGAKGRSTAAAQGFSTAMENHLRDIMDCFFPTTCAAYPEARCLAFQTKWSAGGNREVFATRANACESGWYRRR